MSGQTDGGRGQASTRPRAARHNPINPWHRIRPPVDPTPDLDPGPYGNPEPEWLEIDWLGEHYRTIEIAGTPVSYVEAGPPEAERDRLAVVLIHGLSGCWQNWLDTIPVLARRHRVLALDLPGFGDSPEPGWQISIESYGRFLRAFCDAVGVTDAALVGHSMGGFVAAEAAVCEPERFERLVLVSAAGVSSRRLRQRPVGVFARGVAAVSPHIVRWQTLTFKRPRARRIGFRAVFTRADLIQPEFVWEAYHGGARGTAFVKALVSLSGYDIVDRLEDVEVPALIVWGANDVIVPPQDAYGFAKRLRNSRVLIFPDTGHMPMAERSVRFNEELERFLGD